MICCLLVLWGRVDSKRASNVRTVEVRLCAIVCSKLGQDIRMDLHYSPQKQKVFVQSPTPSDLDPLKCWQEEKNVGESKVNNVASALCEVGYQDQSVAPFDASAMSRSTSTSHSQGTPAHNLL